MNRAVKPVAVGDHPAEDTFVLPRSVRAEPIRTLGQVMKDRALDPEWNKAAPATAEQIASKAATLVSGDRATTHGDKKENFKNIAALWTAWLEINHTLGKPLGGGDVAKLMSLLKIARMESGTFNVDDAVDAAGYAAIAGELAGHEDAR